MNFTVTNAIVALNPAENVLFCWYKEIYGPLDQMHYKQGDYV